MSIKTMKSFMNILIGLSLVLQAISYPTVHDKVKDNMTNLQDDTHLDIADPNAPLTTTDLAKLLMNHCNNVTKDCIKHERERTEDKINLVIASMTKQIANVIVSKERDNLANKESIKELELKLDTVIKYQEQVFYNHRLETSREIGECTRVLKDVVHDGSSSPCDVCEKASKTPRDVSEHLTNHSSAESPYEQAHVTRNETLDQLSNPCTICGNTFNSQYDLQLHMNNYHCNFSQQFQLPYLANNTESYSIQPENQDLYLNEASPEEPILYHNLSYHMHAQDVRECCNLCNKVFSTRGNLAAHTENQHDANQSFQCNNSGQVFPSSPPLEKHMNTKHLHPGHNSQCESSARNTWGRDQCDSNACPIEETNVHIQNEHVPESQLSTIHCTFCEQTFHDMRHLNIHVKEHHQPNTGNSVEENLSLSNQSLSDVYNSNNHSIGPLSTPLCTTPVRVTFSPMLQVDGNNTLADVSLSPQYPATAQSILPSNTLENPDIIPAGNALSSSAGIQLQYTLSSIKQTRRLLENTHRSALDIRFNNPQTIRGHQHPTNVSIDCNTGVYISVVKPALEAITIGWQVEISSTLIICEDKRDSTELSGRKVSTKLVLFLTENSTPSVKSKVVLHFYHTSSTLQVQGSSLLSSGVTSPVWLVKNFLEPLATTHINQNREAIAGINSTVRVSVTKCNECEENINPTASKPKDQELSCSRCGLFYHKRCTDRRQTTANWKKSPWYCQPCLLRGQAQSPVLNPGARVFTPPYQNISQTQAYGDEQLVRPQDTAISLNHSPTAQPHGVPTAVSAQQESQGRLLSPEPVILSLDTATTAATTQSTSTPRASLVPTTTSIPVICPPPTFLHPPLSQSGPAGTGPAPTPQATQIQPRFPNNAGRQRTSNVPLENPEMEFQRTALDSCRSTIVQQEADLKRLNEALDIRNKRIMQLEDQIGIAASYVSSRDTNARDAGMTDSDPRCKNLSQIGDKLNNLLAKISTVIDQFTSRSQAVNIYNNTSTTNRQAVYDRDTQTISDSYVQSNDSMKEHGQLMEALDSEEIILQCTVCSNIFNSNSDLENHIETIHREPSLCLDAASGIPQPSQKL